MSGTKTLACEGDKKQAGLDSAEALVDKGTVFVRTGLFEELPSAVTPEPEFFSSWMVVPDGIAEEVTRRTVDSNCMLSSETQIEASAFGCDSKVLIRAVTRALEKAADQAFDFAEIMEIDRREDSGLDYVSILARAVRIQRDSAANLVESDMASACVKAAGH